MKKGIMLFAIIVLLIGCSNGNTPEPTGKKPGQFSATVLSDAMGGNNAARSVDLGTYTITSSKSIYFILRNVGDFPITNITLTAGKLAGNGAAFQPITDNGVTANPSIITVLETSGKTSVENIIEVAVNHGNIIGLIGQQYVHKKDFLGTTIRIEGKSIDENNTPINVLLDVDIGTLIKVASFDIVYGDDFTPAKKYEIRHGVRFGYIIPASESRKVRLHNTGNTNLYLIIQRIGFFMENWEVMNQKEEVLPNAYSDLFTSGGYDGDEYYFYVDTGGSMFDNKGNNDLVFRAGTSIIQSSNNGFAGERPFIHTFNE